MHYAIFGWNVAISDSKRKLRKFLRQRGWSNEVQFGWVNRQTFSDSSRYQAAFGQCVIYDLAQRTKFRPDFSVVPSYGCFNH